MEDNAKKEAAKRAFDTFDKALSFTRYPVRRKQPDKLLFNCGTKEDLMPFAFYVSVDASRCIVRCTGYLPFRFREDMIVDGCKAACFLNYNIFNGAFCVELRNGYISFVINESYEECDISLEAAIEMLNTLVATMNLHKDKLLYLARGSITFEEFLEQK